MSKKIFKTTWIVAILVFMVSLVVVLGISYNYFSNLQKKQLKNETELAAQGVGLSGREYFEGLNTEDYRITWIDAEGKVLYDNEADSEVMENHLEREEVKEALETGYGEAVRYSMTLADKQLYAAIRLSDGTILRLSIVQVTIWTLFLGFAQPIGIAVILAFVVAFVLASRLAEVIVKPINEIDPGEPEKYYGKENYKEVEPLLRHISAQQKQLRLDREKIEQTALIRQEFSANVSHELKTPLHAISGYAELLENGMVKDEDVKPFAGKIRAESLRITALVEDIIHLTKLDNADAQIRMEECDLFRIAENAVDSLENAADEMDVTIEISGTETPMKGVPQTLYSIVYNLCDNAIKYNHRGGKVSVTVAAVKNQNVLTVTDTGIGIPEESMERIFERFYRVDKSRSRAVGGTGLGLSIVKHAVMMHNGHIEVESTEGSGSKFTVIFPVL
ncbi:MAG: ATP-binding protein [Lachnospiraceae bacterium]|nr:ATP-binding protein [Lachnospiraceae bacterium]